MKKVLISVIMATLAVQAHEYNLKNGWNLIGATEDITDFSTFKSNGTVIWVYEDDWRAVNFNSDKISKGSGFWFKSNSATTVSTDIKTDTINIPTTKIRAFNLSDTGQTECFSSAGDSVNCQNAGQDGSYSSNNSPKFTKNGDGTTKDNITDLLWQTSADRDGNGVINATDKLTQSEALTYCENLNLAGYDDWRLPDIKTIYSLINFNGEDVSGYSENDTTGLKPFIDTNYFDFGYGDTSAGERIIDAQWATSTLYVSTTMNGDKTMFGLNLADGRIKGYGLVVQNSEKKFYVQCVRGNLSYGTNSFSSSNNTIKDSNTNLMWQKDDSKNSMDWDSAINYCENLSLDSYSDWRVPNIRELQSIVDYTKSPSTTNSSAIDELFNSTEITNEKGEKDYGYYWSSTTHKAQNGNNSSATYISFGRAMGYMNGNYYDVHGAGAQRSDPKISIANSNLDNSYQKLTTSNGKSVIAHGPQGDIIRTLNFVRCVRDIN